MKWPLIIKTFVPTIILFILLFVVTAANAAPTPAPAPAPMPTSNCVHTLTPSEICDPKIAPQYGISGYVRLFNAPSTPAEMCLTENGATVTFLITFVAFSPDADSCKVTLDPKGGLGLTIEQVYDNGIIRVNDLIHYNVSSLTLNSGDVVAVSAKLQRPILNSTASVSFPVAAVGIITNYAMIDETEVIVHV